MRHTESHRMEHLGWLRLATSDQVTPLELLRSGELRPALCSLRPNTFGGASILFNALERIPALRLTPGIG